MRVVLLFQSGLLFPLNAPGYTNWFFLEVELHFILLLDFWSGYYSTLSLVYMGTIKYFKLNGVISILYLLKSGY